MTDSLNSTGVQAGGAAALQLNTERQTPSVAGDGVLISREYQNARTMNDFTSPEELYDTLIASIRKYHPSDDISMVEKAYSIAYNAHKGQKRKSGEPYIIHPLCVAIILANLELDKETIVAGLLHDVVEDTVMTNEEICREFGKEV